MNYEARTLDGVNKRRANSVRLEAEVDTYREKADRAEQWLRRVYTEIEDRFLRQSDGQRGVAQRRRA